MTTYAYALAKVCQDCGEKFYVIPDEHWKTVCRFCYRGEQRLKRTVVELTRRVRVLEAKLASNGLDTERLGKLIRLCHPDRHGNSSMSNEVTQWLLTLRKDSRL